MDKGHGRTDSGREMANTNGQGEGGVDYWRKRALDKERELEELEVEYQEFQDSSRTLEEEMETEVDSTKKKLDEATRALSALKAKHEDMAERNRERTQEAMEQIDKLQSELVKVQNEKSQLLARKRQLEQDNDDTSRREREALATVGDLSEKLDKLFEENAWLQTELEEAQRNSNDIIHHLRNEIAEQKSELAIRQLQIQRQIELNKEREAPEPSPELAARKPSPRLSLTPPFQPVTTSSGEASPIPRPTPAYPMLSLYDRKIGTPPRARRSLADPASFSSPSADSPVHIVNDMLVLVQDLETRISSRVGFTSPLKREGLVPAALVFDMNGTNNIFPPASPATFPSASCSTHTASTTSHSLFPSPHTVPRAALSPRQLSSTPTLPTTGQT
eukprot:TRINITY_DN2882_c0_g1_i1.p1 TRINITY_DN2882_c0_g1~~TRINITY_DN2882_c0_g1_i1.p1  ORF type:complete len:390 (-),score=75.19 TRINITY_DN2882_c0_g1_i1:202-1371(-)